jgi:hypothetical protein
MTNIKWVADSVVENGMSRSTIIEIIEALYANPNQWAEYPDPVPSASWARMVATKYDAIEVVTRGGNNLAASHPNKKYWTVYLRYNPTMKKGEKIETK